jgi:signal transduction histidine kinase
MKAAPEPENESDRLQALLEYKILDTDFESDYDHLTSLAAYICETPTSLISLIDPKRQWFKSAQGLNVRETSREIAFCSHAILQPNVFLINDALTDDRFSDNPLVLGNPKIRFYAGAPLITPNGMAIGTLCVIDYQPRQLTVEQMTALQSLATQVIALLELRLAVFKLKEINSTKNKLLAIISHDLRAPFNGILSFSELLANSIDSLSRIEIKSLAKDIFISAESAFSLVENLLHWARWETEVIPFVPITFLADQLIDEVMILLRTVANQKEVRLIAIPNPDLQIYGDRDMIRSVIQNLISNSIKFTLPQGQVKLSAQICQNQIEITIEDNGVGMTKKQIQNLTADSLTNGTNFYSTNGTAGEAGTGLGLRLCTQFIKRHGGDMSVDSEVGVGTKIVVSLPLV